MLIHPALHIGEFSLDLIIRSRSHTYFIRYENKGGILPGEAVELFFGGSQGPIRVSIYIKEEVGASQSYAVYQYDSPCQLVAA